MSNIIQQLEREQMTRDVPDFGPGDTVVVQVKVKEGERERLQAFEGVVIARRNRGVNSAFTVRKISHGEGVERVFQTYSPAVADIKVLRRGDVRRAAPASRHASKRRSEPPHSGVLTEPSSAIALGGFFRLIGRRLSWSLPC